MKLLHAVVTLATALVASAQSDGPESAGLTAGLFPDFPQQCLSACTPFNDDVRECGHVADSQSEQAAVDCLCNGSFKSDLEACGNCIAQNTADVTSSESFVAVAQLGSTFVRRCGKPVNIQGVPPKISSYLDPAAYASATSTDLATFDEVTSATSSPTAPTSAPAASSSAAGSSRSSSSRQTASTSNGAASPSSTASSAPSSGGATSSASSVAASAARAIALPLLLVAITLAAPVAFL
ncbi:hypothetical protein JCM10908_004374 [Rhodotorula pacifica]|uniref:uncharacterized protein n=1 Tax=Rhodotorula pacifica TaxID=1495444 RepID=UPI0031760C79